MADALLQPQPKEPSWTPPVNKILAYFHGGRVFIEILPLLARVGLVASGFLFALWWIAYWHALFHDYERWSLVLAALVHLAFCILVYFYGRIAWLRLEHLRRVPPGETAALRCLPILLRMFAELLLISTTTLSFSLLAMPGVPEPHVDQVVPDLGWLATGIGTGLWTGFWALLLLVLLYGLANAVETYLAIEHNTRTHHGAKRRHDDLVRQAAD